jgi:cell division protein ZapE
MPHISLTERNAAVPPEHLVAQFVPPKRFVAVRFDNYAANPQFESQTACKTRLQQFVNEAQGPKPLLGWALGRKKPKAVSLYLDGGFGVGKTHLLAATWHGFAGKKAFLSFQELVFVIGALRMPQAVTVFRQFELLAIDEFELDDVGNTLMVCMFLSQLLPQGTRVVTTSNTIPGQLGAGRFNADDFKREIASIAGHFETLGLDGPDYRQREQHVVAALRPKSEVVGLFEADSRRVACEDFDALNLHLSKMHFIRFAGLLDGLEVLYIQHLAPMYSQDTALRFVHFIDKLYDRQIQLAASGIAGFELRQLFPDSYRYGGYAKKYARCLSRLAELLREYQPPPRDAR